MAKPQSTAPTAKIVPHLWFDHQAAEAAKFYASVFPGSRVDSVIPIPADTPSGPAGSVDVVEFTLAGQPFMAISAGPPFKFNPSISFIVNFEQDRRKIDEVWKKLSAGGQALMPLDKYPFSERYGWVQDKYGLTWQLMLTDPQGDPRPAIVPSLMFAGKNAGRAQEAMDFYLSVFKDSKRGMLAPYGADQAPDKEGTVMFADFMLEGQWFAVMDSARAEDAGFNEAVSLLVHCKDQKEVDFYWEKLSAVREAEQCGWVKDRFGVSWQIVPVVLDQLLKDHDKGRAKRATEAMLQMKKLDVAGLEQAAAGHA